MSKPSWYHYPDNPPESQPQMPREPLRPQPQAYTHAPENHPPNDQRPSNEPWPSGRDAVAAEPKPLGGSKSPRGRSLYHAARPVEGPSP